MTEAFYLFVFVVVICAVVWYAMQGYWPSRARPRDPVINIDQWTEQRRQHLADLHQPAAKFIEARRHDREAS